MNTVDSGWAAPAVRPKRTETAAARMRAGDEQEISPRRRRTRTKLIDAAIPLLAAKGVAGTSIEEFAEAAGMTRGAFYSNFSSRDELVLAVCDAGISRALERVNAVADTGLDEILGAVGTADTDPHTFIELAVERFFTESPESAEWVLAEREIHLHAMRVPELRGKFDELLDAHFQQFATVIGAVLDRLGGRATIPMPELVELLATVTKEASMKAIPDWSGSGPLRIDPRPTTRILQAFTVFEPDCCG